ncbi:MAG: SNF2-related protein [Bacteroides sp.]|nr:SNF2-related protein [Bacteroides sp.]
MAKKFGTTWWGEQWLNSLSKIDYSNRLPRGARYARNGSVKSIDINNGKISARVAGSLPTPYKETIEVPQFDKAKIRGFIDRLMGQPLILASLMRRKLDPRVLTAAKESGLEVFPSSWKDLGMHCSCPDWAVPCKHLAAVIYKVSEEIDNNPFLVFELHGLDLLDELKKRGLLPDDISKKLNPIDIKELLRPQSDDAGDVRDWTPTDPDFSRIPAIGGDLLELLADNPPFSIDGDFKKTYVKYLGVTAKSAAKIMGTSLGGDVALDAFDNVAKIAFHINKSFDTEVMLTGADDGKTKRISFADFVTRLSTVNPASYITNQPWVEVMHKMWLLAVNLLSKKDVVPMIVSVDRKYRIVWRPATLHPEIRQIVGAVTGCVPEVVTDSRGNVIANGGEWLLCIMLNAIIAGVGEMQHVHDPLFDLFFLDEPQQFDAIGQGGVAGGIRVWTDKFFMLDEDSGFEIQIDEMRSGFAVSLYVIMTDTGLRNRISFPDFMKRDEFKSSRIEVISKLSSLIDYMPGLHDYISDNGVKPMEFDSRTFIPFLFKTLPLMRLLGVEVALPKSLRELVRPRVSVRIDRKADANGKSYVRLDELLSFNWEIALGDTLVSVEEFKELFKRVGELIKFKGHYIYATLEELDKIWKELAKGDKLTSREILAIALAEKYKDAPVALTDGCRELLAKLRDMPATPLPEDLNADLRPYQLRGYEWMMHNLTLGFGSIIADDMGLGKTLQVIAVLLRLKESGRLDKHKALVVVPTGLLTNWQKECARFAPALNVTIYHGTARDLDKFDGDVLLTSYGVVRSDVTRLKKHKWELLVIDEAQNIKNTSTAQTKAVNSINASSHIAMSGTPVENRLSEYWSIMNFANKGLFGSLKDFNARYTRPIQLEGNKEMADQFRATTAPFMLRRLKSDKSIISDLPDKIERDEYASLTSEQSALYQQTLNEAMREIEGIKGSDHASLFRREGLVLQMIMALKQICNHPAQFLKTGKADPELSGKAMMLIDLVEGIVNSGEKVLIFTQFKEMGALIVKMLEKIDIQSMFYHGGTTLKKRAEMVDRFQNQRSAQVFVLSLKAAGTGLNLTAATNVIHFDLWWNPAVEAQATDRAYRIGQHRNVQVYRFITKGTFEEKINAMIQDKKKLADLTVGTGEKWLAEMSDSELRSIFTLETPKK